jgi:hypothetical protein
VIKLNICAARIPRMTHAQYARYARDNHARLVLGTQAVSRYMTSYVQHHVFDGAYGDLSPASQVDSVSHIVAPTMEDQLAAINTREYREVIAPDEPQFADSRRAVFTFMTEQPMALPTSGSSPLRLLHYGRNATGHTSEAFQAQWLTAHAEVLAHQPRLLPSVRRAVLNVPFTPHEGESTFDAMGALGFLDRSDVPAICDYVNAMEQSLGEMLDRDRSYFLLAEAVVVRGTLD